MRIVVRSSHDITIVSRALADMPADGWLVEVSKYKAPRTWSQQKKLHAMIGEIATFSGETPKRMKRSIKGFDFWPTEIVTLLGVEQEHAKSEADLTKDEEEMIITHLYMIGEFLQSDGFAWSEGNG